MFVKPDDSRSLHETIAAARDAHVLAEHKGTFEGEAPKELEDSQQGDLHMDLEAAFEHHHSDTSPNTDYGEVLDFATEMKRIEDEPIGGGS